MTDDMVERVARAIYELPMRDGDPFGLIVYTSDYVDGNNRDESKAATDEIIMMVARAAIETMREPTEAMLAAGYPRVDTGNPYDTCLKGDLAEAWQAMIDAALASTHTEGEAA